MFIIIALASLGFCISLYTYIIEKKIKETPEFKPVCDISDRISCSKPIKSSYSNIFFFSNAIVGMAFYVVVALLAILQVEWLLLLVTIGGSIVSCFLAYLLYFKVKSLCLLCTSLYIINFLLLLIVLKVFSY